MALQTLGCIVGSEIIVTDAYQAGSKLVGPQTIPAGFAMLFTAIDLRQVNSLIATIAQQSEMSIDGTNWFSLGGSAIDLSKSGYSLPGGVLTGPDGEPIRATGFWTSLPSPELTTRSIRVTLMLSHPLTAGITLMAW